MRGREEIRFGVGPQYSSVWCRCRHGRGRRSLSRAQRFGLCDVDEDLKSKHG